MLFDGGGEVIWNALTVLMLILLLLSLTNFYLKVIITASTFLLNVGFCFVFSKMVLEGQIHFDLFTWFVMFVYPMVFMFLTYKVITEELLGKKEKVMK